MGSLWSQGTDGGGGGGGVKPAGWRNLWGHPESHDADMEGVGFVHQ